MVGRFFCVRDAAALSGGIAEEGAAVLEGAAGLSAAAAASANDSFSVQTPKFREKRAVLAEIPGKSAARALYLRQGRAARPTVYSGGLFVRAQNMGNSPHISKILKKSEKTVVFLLTFTGIYGIVFKLSQESTSKTPDKQSDRRNLSKNFQKT